MEEIIQQMTLDSEKALQIQAEKDLESVKRQKRDDAWYDQVVCWLNAKDSEVERLRSQCTACTAELDALRVRLLMVEEEVFPPSSAN